MKKVKRNAPDIRLPTNKYNKNLKKHLHFFRKSAIIINGLKIINE